MTDRLNQLGFQRNSFFSSTEREQLLLKVDSLRQHWLHFDNEVAHSLGAASYRYPEGDKSEYRRWVRRLNPILEENFFELYQRIVHFLEEHLQAPVRLAPQIGHPGFFVVDPGGLSFAHRIYHLDIQYMGIRWKPFVPFGKLVTFTGVLQLPVNGGGLNIKPLHMFECIHDSKPERAQKIASTEVVYLPYQEGDLVIHDGMVYHQIAPVSPSGQAGERRVTFQGHGVKNGKFWEIYW